ncbi:MAG: response regulator transcription factor [Sphingomonadales bacterium]|nr:response regulator transcription factor [Sphingomonadales bacterium]
MNAERIIVADDHPLFRDALVQSLRAEFPEADVVGFDNLPDAQSAARNGPSPDMFLLDLVFPGMEGPSSISKLRKEFPAASLIVLTMLEDQHVADQLLDAGADGFLGKGLTSGAIMDGIRAVHAGEYVVNVTTQGSALEKPMLTPRQYEILCLICANKPNKLIARDLGLSHFTVRNHVSILMRNLKVQRRNQLGPRAMALGLIAVGDPQG